MIETEIKKCIMLLESMKESDNPGIHGMIFKDDPVTPEIAANLELATGVLVRLWLNLKRNYRGR